MEQKSAEWYEFRKSRIGGSDAPIIAGLSPWSNALQCWLEKLGKIPSKDFSNNWAVQRGVRLEPVVLGMVEIALDVELSPAILTHPTDDYLMASLDGWNEEKRIAVEIKVGNRKDHIAGVVPKKYRLQLQHQMYVCGLDEMTYVSYYLEKGADDLSGDLKFIQYKRDPELLARYLLVAERFHHCLVNDVPPEVTKLDI